MSKVEVNTIEPQCGTTLTVGKCTTSVAVPGNVVKSNAVQASDGGNIVNQCGTTITLGASGDTVALASGASQTGFGSPGQVIDWQTGSIKTATFTGVADQGFFVDTSGGAVTCNLPAGSAGDAIALNDYAETWDGNNCTVTPDGTDKINGVNASAILDTKAQSLTFVYIDATRGWKTVIDSSAQITGSTGFIAAAGGDTTITCGDYKTHIFTGPGTFTVSDAGTPAGSNTVEYLVVAGGGSGNVAGYGGGGGGGGGARENYPSPAFCGFAASNGAYPITVGAGGSAGPNPAPVSKGANSVYSTLTATGGGAGSGSCTGPGDYDGGSGGGGGGAYLAPNPGAVTPGGAGNSPAVPCTQGTPGGAGKRGGGPAGPVYYGGGGGGGSVAGADAPGPGNGGDGKNVACAMIGPTAPSYGTPGPGSGRYFSGGGGGSRINCGTQGCGGAGGGSAGKGPGGPQPPTDAGTINTGGGSGGGGGYPGPTILTGAGGSGIVIIRYKFQ